MSNGLEVRLGQQLKTYLTLDTSKRQEWVRASLGCLISNSNNSLNQRWWGFSLNMKIILNKILPEH